MDILNCADAQPHEKMAANIPSRAKRKRAADAQASAAKNVPAAFFPCLSKRSEGQRRNQPGNQLDGSYDSMPVPSRAYSFRYMRGWSDIRSLEPIHKYRQKQHTIQIISAAFLDFHFIPRCLEKRPLCAVSIIIPGGELFNSSCLSRTKYCEFQAAGGKTYDLSAAGIPRHIFFGATRETYSENIA